MIKLIIIGVAAFLLYVLQREVYRRLWNSNLKASVKFAVSQMFEGETAELLEVVENRKRLPLPVLKVKFSTGKDLVFQMKEGNSKVTDQFYWNQIFQVGGGEKITRTMTFLAKKRGYYKISGVDLVSTDLFHSYDFVDRIQDSSYLYVYPRAFTGDQLKQSLQKLNGEILAKQHLLEDPFEYRGIREYQPYDDMRSVNWKATAKTGELKVNQKNYTSLQTVRIFFNIEDTGILKKYDEVEMCLRIVAGIAQFFLACGIRIAVYGNGKDIISDEVLSIEPGAGSGQMDRIYKMLARIDTSKPVASFSDTFGERLLTENRSVRTVIISPNCYPDFEKLIREYDSQGGEYTWFYPVWDKAVEGLPDDLYKKIQWIYVKEEMQ